MIVVVDAQPVELIEPEVMNAFSVRAPVGATVEQVAMALGTQPADRPDHVWVPVATVLDLAGPRGASWLQGWDAMIEFAAGRGWMSDDRSLIMAHVESPSGEPG